MSFYEKLNQTATNVSVTENGMLGYKTTYHPLVDMNFKISSYRNLKDDDIIKDFKKILMDKNDVEYALKFIFMIRDAREGLGERRLFRVCLKELLNHNMENKDEIIHNIVTKYIPEYGRYDDLFVLVGTKYEDEVDEFVRKTLKSDFANMKQNKSISLLGKWMPSENASSKETKNLAKHFIKSLNATPREYRRMLSSLRSYLDVLEQKLSANEWEKVDYNTVPSKANLKYMDAFLKHDEERRRDYLAKLRLGVKDTKINSSVNYPHEIVNKYTNGYWNISSISYDETLEQLWKNLKDVQGLKNTIVVRDGSGSMTSRVGGTSISALEIATALTIYCSERLNDDFKDKFITFSSRAELVDLSKDKSLRSKISTCYKYDDCSNTDLSRVFSLILNTAICHKMKQEDIPEQILIISDMEFDSCLYGSGNVIENAQNEFAQYGYELPKLVFWNVNSRSNTIPCRYNKNGVLLVSGFSVNILKMVLNGETDPYKALVKELDSSRYENIEKIKLLEEKKISKYYKKRDFETPDFLK